MTRSAVEMDPRDAMKRGQLSFSATMYCAAVKYGCTSGLRLGCHVAEIISPIHHKGGRAYANMYFAFSNGTAYDSRGRWRLKVPDFTQPSQCSCNTFHEDLQKLTPEASLDFGKLRKREFAAALKVYSGKTGLVDAKATMDHIRQKAHASGLNKSGALATDSKANKLAAMAKQIKYGVGEPPEVVFAKRQKKMTAALQLQNDQDKLGVEVQFAHLAKPVFCICLACGYDTVIA